MYVWRNERGVVSMCLCEALCSLQHKVIDNFAVHNFELSFLLITDQIPVFVSAPSQYSNLLCFVSLLGLTDFELWSVFLKLFAFHLCKSVGPEQTRFYLRSGDPILAWSLSFDFSIMWGSIRNYQSADKFLGSLKQTRNGLRVDVRVWTISMSRFAVETALHNFTIAFRMNVITLYSFVSME